jgi:site-specific recombinase XerD
MAISKEIIQHLKQFIEWKKSLDQPTKPTLMLFIGGRGKLIPQGLRRIWNTAVKTAGLSKELSIHCARHTIAVHLLKKTKNLRQVQKQFGTSPPATTANMYADIFAACEIGFFPTLIERDGFLLSSKSNNRQKKPIKRTIS